MIAFARGDRQARFVSPACTSFEIPVPAEYKNATVGTSYLGTRSVSQAVFCLLPLYLPVGLLHDYFFTARIQSPL